MLLMMLLILELASVIFVINANATEVLVLLEDLLVLI